MPHKNLIQGLKELLANTYTLYLKTQNYHWNVEGPYFYSLHLLFETQYKELAQALDTIAERIRSLGEIAPGSYTAFSTLTSIPDAKTPIKALEMVSDLHQSHKLLIQQLNELLNLAKQSNDEATQNLFVERLETHEKIAWMLRSHLV